MSGRAFNQYRPRSRSFNDSSLQQYIDSVSQESQGNEYYDDNYYQTSTPSNDNYAYSQSYQQTTSQQNTSSTAFQKPQTPLTGQKNGWLTKMGHIVPSWKQRWFVLDQGKLYYYASNTDASSLKGKLDVQGGSVDVASSYVNKLNCFHIQSPSGKHLYVYSKDASDSQSWIEALCSIGGAKQVEPGVKKGTAPNSREKSFVTANSNESKSENFRSNTITSTFQPASIERGRPRSRSDPQAPQSPPKYSNPFPPPRKAAVTNAPPPRSAAPPSRTQSQASQPPPSLPPREPVSPSLPPRQPANQAPAPSRQPISTSQRAFPPPAKKTTGAPPPTPQRAPVPSRQPMTSSSSTKPCPTCGTVWEATCQFCGSCGKRF